tara:strand:- start:27213 stop:27989 length:777 start_codon:yes stop_codon:yes gene_type:complete
MKQKLRIIHRYFIMIGINLLDTKNFFLNFFWYLKCLSKFKNDKELFELDFWPIFGENKISAGSIKSHYFIQDLFVSQLIFENSPKNILDIGSRIDGFVAHVSTFREIDVLDIRPLEGKIKNINFKKHDLMNEISSLEKKYECVTCLHALEHFGLGRYGDPIDPKGHLKGIKNIHKILSKNGTCYLSFPLGRNRVEFNAHRVFSIKYIKPILESFFTIESFSYISDDGSLFENVNIENGKETNFNCNYGCSIFELKKRV